MFLGKDVLIITSWLPLDQILQTIHVKIVPPLRLMQVQSIAFIYWLLLSWCHE
jgi:hypothetical protein